MLFFGILRDIVKENAIDLTINKGVTIANLKEFLLKKYENLNAYSNFSIAVNEAYIDSDYVLQQNDVVALIPPVSGG